MSKRLFAGCVAVLLAAGVVIAADAIKVELKAFKFDPSSDLLGFNEGDGKLFFYTNGKATADVTVPEDGEYTVVVEASCDDAKNEKAKMKVSVGNEVVKDKFELTTTDTKEYTFPAKLKKGPAKLTVEFLNDEFKEGEFDRNLYVHSAKIEKK